MAEPHKPLDSKKWIAFAISLGAIIGTGALAVSAGGVTAAVVLPEVLKYVATVTVSYFGAQGVVDALKSRTNDSGKVADEKQ